MFKSIKYNIILIIFLLNAIITLSFFYIDYYFLQKHYDAVNNNEYVLNSDSYIIEKIEKIRHINLTISFIAFILQSIVIITTYRIVYRHVNNINGILNRFISNSFNLTIDDIQLIEKQNKSCNDFIQIYRKIYELINTLKDYITQLEVSQNNAIISERKLKCIFDNSPFAIITFTKKGIFVDSNNLAKIIFNDFIHLYQSVNWIEYMSKIVGEKILFDTYYEFEYKGMQLSFMFNIIEGNGGICTVHDRTREKEQKSKIKRLDEIISHVSRIARIGFFEINRTNDEIITSDQLSRMLIDVNKIKTFINYPSLDTYSDNTKKGMVQDGSNYYSIQYDINNDTIKGYCQNITDRMSYKEAFQNIENKYNTLIYVDILSMFILDIDENITFYNDSFAYIIESDMSSEIGTNILTFIPLYADVKNGTINETILICKNKQVDVYIAVKPIINNKDIHSGYIGVVIDVTDKKKIEEELITKNRELQDKNEMLEQFAYVTAHDLRTPLRSVNAFVDRLLKHIEENLQKNTINVNKIKDYSEFIRKSIVQMSNNIDDSLDYSRLMKHVDISKKINIRDCIGISLISLSSLINKHNVIINTFKENVLIYGDESSLTSMFQNLITNGIKFNKSASIIINISYRIYKDVISIHVKDNGIGIESKYHDRIFKMFQRLHGDEIKGSGIGLTIVERVVKLHNGKIKIKSELNVGTEFIIEFPIKTI